MFTSSVKVPYITPETIAAIEKVQPLISLAVDIPLTDTEDKAVRAASIQMNKGLEKYETIRRTQSVTLDQENAFWEVTFEIWGD